jgi:DNA primase
MNITNEMINEIRNKNDIVDVISKYIPLTQRGKNYFGVCPFHDDHSPSMSVSREKQIFTCFSCGATGNVFTFVANYEHIGFYDAVRLLGSRVGYDLGSAKITKNKNAKYYEIYDLVTKLYQNSLSTAQGKNALEYLDDRQIDKKTIKKFKIGLSSSKISITDYLVEKGYDLKTLIDLGITNDNGSDVFVNRIMFPLYDLEGNVVAFSGRIYNTKDPSKYVNTKETAIFKKGTILYNYHNAKELLKKNESVIVMEGFMDVIRADSVGITNCIATMGTALTKQNANLLKKMANNIILCFDGDKAGLEATIKAIEIFKELDVSPKIVRLPEDLDPDEYILKYGKEKFKYEIDNPESSIEFLMDLHKQNKNLSDIGDISKYINESLVDLLIVEDEVLVNLTLRKMSDEYKVDYDVLKKKYEDLKNKNKKEVTVTNSSEKKKLSQIDIASKELLAYMLNDENVLQDVEESVTFFPNDTIRLLANEMIYYYHKYGNLNVADFISYIASNEDELNLLNELMTMKVNNENKEEAVNDYIKVINSYPIKRKMNEINKEIMNETDPIKQANILKESMALRGVNNDRRD